MHPQTQRTQSHTVYHQQCGRDAWRNMPVRPIRLKRVMLLRDIKNADLAAAVINKHGNPLSRSTISSLCNKGVVPAANCPDFKAQVEQYLHTHGVADAAVATCWQEDPIKPVARAPKTLKSLDAAAGDDQIMKEATMLTPKALRHFGLFKSPFLDDLIDADDVYMSASHRYAEAAMMDAARSGGFVAVYGECGAGKSALRRKMIAELQRDGDVRVIYPQCIDKRLLSSGLILEAIVEDLAPGTKMKRTNEARARQVRDILLASSHAGMRHVLLLEEAHDLNEAAMKQLKRLWEIEDGFRKILGIVMIGQQELRDRLNPQTSFNMREVIMRCLIAELAPLGDELEAYVEHKFKRRNTDISQILSGDWAAGIRKRLTYRDGRSNMYPLAVNNLIARGMNLAAEIGEDRVTAEVILSS